MPRAEEAEGLLAGGAEVASTASRPTTPDPEGVSQVEAGTFDAEESDTSIDEEGQQQPEEREELKSDDGGEWEWWDRLQVLFFVVLGGGSFGISLWPGVEAYRASCTAGDGSADDVPASAEVMLTRAWIDSLLGASTLMVRFGAIPLAFVQWLLLRLVGYPDASLPQTVLAPRQAALLSDAAVQARKHPDWGKVPKAAAWQAIVNVDRSDERPSTWNAARNKLSVRQAVWASGTKLLLWHWTQPLSYFAVFGAYFFSLSPNQKLFGTVVAVREGVYMVCTLLALYINPAYLLMELDSVWKPRSDEAVGAARCTLSMIDRAVLKQRAVYFLAPHHYVTVCLYRGATAKKELPGGGDDKPLAYLFVVIGVVQTLCDCASACALLILLQQPDPTFGLAIGYWLTTLGLLVGASWCALEFGLTTWFCKAVSEARVTMSGKSTPATEPAETPGDENRKPKPQDLFLGLCGILVGGMFMLGVFLVIIALPQLFGWVCGLARLGEGCG